MQAGELLSLSSSSATATATLYPEDCGASAKLGVSASFGNGSEAEQMESELKSLGLELEEKLEVDDGDEDEDEDEEEEFSFVCANPDGSPISADDAFHSGQIRPMYPLFNRDLLFVENSETRDKAPPPLRKVFVEKRDDTLELESKGVVEGTYCEWSPGTAELGKKSNSTGSSKLWRFRDLMTMHRSSSDGKDAFVFLNNPTPTPTPTKSPTANNPHNLQTQPPKLKPPSSPHHTHYVTSKAHKGVHKRRTYLPYRQDLLGFFTTVNGFSKNVHPF